MLPGFIISDFFKRLSYQDVKTVILIGPNHKEKGSCHILTSVYGWETVFVASVDFSHYLPAAKAREKDKETLKILKSFNYDKLYSLNNDYVDSPKSVGILFSIMQSLGKHDFSVLNNTNSGDILKDDLVPTTSYFEIAFYGD